jgi:Kef-type K+ transport system membrane component KefB
VSTGAALADILAVLLAAKLAAEGAERLGVPAVVGEILAGLVVGPSVLGLVEPSEVLAVLAELGVILLLLEVGLQTDPAELGAVGGRSLSVAGVGVALPFALGYGAVAAMGEGGSAALFTGAALTATSVGITARVFADLRALATPEARTVLGAAVADDVIGLVLLTVVVRAVTEGSVSAGSVAALVAAALAFLVVAGAAGLRLAPPLFDRVDRVARSAGTMVALALAFTQAVAELASVARLAPIVGAFVAGLALGRSRQADRIGRELAPVGHLLVPVFFLQIGIETEVAALARPAVLATAGVLVAGAVAGKVASGWAMRGSAGDRLLVGLAMVPRGEVGLIFAAIGLRDGVLDQDLYAGLLLVVLATTLATPPLLRARLRRLRATAPAPAAAGPEPAGGWLRTAGGVVDLAGGRPPAHRALDLALDAAVAVRDAAPGPALLDWLGEAAGAPLRWDRRATAALLRVLREGTPRSWRFLETTGVLDRALPELAEAVRRRRADPFDLDPAGALRWRVVEALHDRVADDRHAAAEYARLEHPEWLLLAALLVEAAGDEPPVALARRLAHRLDVGAVAEQELALLVAATGLLRSAAARGPTEDVVLPLAAHLDTPERARALFLLALAVAGDDRLEAARLRDAHDAVQAALAHPELTGRAARNLVGRRRAEAARLVNGDAGVAARLAAAPTAHVLATDAAALARQARLLEPPPRPGEARAAVADHGTGWVVDVAARDFPGLLATAAGALAALGHHATRVTAGTWPDGSAVDSFTVPRGDRPDAAAVAAAVEAALAHPPEAVPVPGAEVRFDDDASPWYTACEVTAPDRLGVLADVAAALPAAGADVHGAVVAVDPAGGATARFELTDRRGQKLDDATRAAIAATLVSGRRPARLLRRR